MENNLYTYTGNFSYTEKVFIEKFWIFRKELRGIAFQAQAKFDDWKEWVDIDKNNYSDFEFIFNKTNPIFEQSFCDENYKNNISIIYVDAIFFKEIKGHLILYGLFKKEIKYKNSDDIHTRKRFEKPITMDLINFFEIKLKSDESND